MAAMRLLFTLLFATVAPWSALAALPNNIETKIAISTDGGSIYSEAVG
jgi:hypothetical protein